MRHHLFFTKLALVSTATAGMLALSLPKDSQAEVLIINTPRSQVETLGNNETAAKRDTGLTQEGFGVRERWMEGFIINSSDKPVDDALVEIRSTSADELLTYWMVRVPLGNLDPGQRVFVREEYPEWLAEPEKIVFDFDPPEDPETPWPRPERANNLRFSGNGSGLTTWFRLSPGSVRFMFRHDGAGDFQVDLKPLKVVATTPVVRHSGDGEGSTLIAVEEEGIYQLDIAAQDNWAIRINSLPREEDGPTVSRDSGSPQGGNQTEKSYAWPIRIDE